MRRWRANARQRARSSGGSTHRHAQAAATPPGVPPADLRLAVRARFFLSDGPQLRSGTRGRMWLGATLRWLSRPHNRTAHIGAVVFTYLHTVHVRARIAPAIWSSRKQDQEIGALFVPWPPTAAGEPAQAREAVAPSQTKRVRGARMARACGRCYARYQIAFMPL